MKVIDAGSWVLVKTDNDVAFAYSGVPCRAIRFERYNQDSAFNGKIVVAHDTARERNVLSRKADITAADFAVPHSTTGNELRRIDRSSKGDSLCRENHRRVNPNNFAAR